VTPLQRGGLVTGAVVCLYLAHQVGLRLIPAEYQWWATVAVAATAGCAAVTMIAGAVYGKTGVTRVFDLVAFLVRRRTGISLPRPDIANPDSEDTAPVPTQKPQGGRHRG